jgi:hypothetical protein
MDKDEIGKRAGAFARDPVCPMARSGRRAFDQMGVNITTIPAKVQISPAIS